MTSLADHHSQDFVKLLYIGESGSGKTSSLLSLAQAGYKIRILDMDNNLDSLVQLMKLHCPERLGQIDFETRRDKPKATQSGPVVNSPRAYVESLKLLEKWGDGSDPSQWGPDTVFVLDTLTSLGDAAMWWAKGINPLTKDPRQWYKAAQDAITINLDMLCSEAFRCNVIVMSHVTVPNDKTGKCYPTAIGSALGPVLARNFPSLILAESSVSGKNTVRRIKTLPTPVLDLKNPVPWEFKEELPLETGLAAIFQKLKETKNAN